MKRTCHDDNLIFGFIITAETDAEGCVYLLDRWLGTVDVLGPDGTVVRQLSREGEGPGETTQPTDLTWLPNGALGITQPSPGKLITIDRLLFPGDNRLLLVRGFHEASDAMWGSEVSEEQETAGGIVCYDLR